MKLGELIAVLCTHELESGENIMQLDVLVHTPGSGEGMVPAEAYVLENENGVKVVHFDAAAVKTEAEPEQEPA